MENDTTAAAANNNTTAKAGFGGLKSNNHDLEKRIMSDEVTKS